ncbi:MAG: hypothetical protein IPN53_08385 [Comamonadaceae bacterium]|nr:hypothetical protein [Comamonadaceae bacterium]
MDNVTHKEKIEKEIIRLCDKNFKALGEIAAALDMNKNTVRSVYLYPMTKAGTLKRSTQFPFKSGTKYTSA